MPRLVLGSRNAKKLAEIRELLDGLPAEVVDLSGYPDAGDVDETGQTFPENARLKAVGYATATGEWVLAEDSGLVVPMLGGRPGVQSARYAGTHGDDAANNQKLTAEVKALPEAEPAAYYVCYAALSRPDGEVVAEAEGRCHGRIVVQPRGEQGFGYDPHFLIAEYHKTFGELPAVVKRALSHRARAVGQLRPAIRRHLIDGSI